MPASIIGGQTALGYVMLNDFVRNPAGATVLLSSGDTNTVQLPASVFIAAGSWTGYFNASTSVVPGNKGVSIKATFDGAQLSTNMTVQPIPPITILTSDYKPLTQILKVTATSPDPNVVLTWGANGVPFGTMQLEQATGIWQGATTTSTPPTSLTVWSSVGGQATMAVTTAVSGGGGGGGGTATGGGGGGGGTATGGSTTGKFTLSVKTVGAGRVTNNAAGISCTSAGTSCTASLAAGATLILTATPDAGAPWKGWGGDCLGTSLTCTVTMSKAKSVTATFK